MSEVPLYLEADVGDVGARDAVALNAVGYRGASLIRNTHPHRHRATVGSGFL